MDLTLVAFYGEKPREFSALVAELQQRLTESLGPGFSPYEPQQVHSTIIGLEGRRDGDRVLNSNFLRLRHERRYMDVRQLIETIDQATDLLPIRIRIGGYKASDRYSFTSRGAHPFMRSFSIHGGVAVAMGWPFEDSVFPSTLDRLRRKFAETNVLHKYHALEVDEDNDLFFVLGNVRTGARHTRSVEMAEREIRAYLERQQPTDIELRPEHLSLVSYADPTLPVNTSKVYPVNDLRRHAEALESLFRESGN